MSVRQYEKGDLYRLRELLLGHGISQVDFIPKIGAIAEIDGIAIALGFVREAEGKLGVWDGLVTNVLCTPEKRNAALDSLVQFLISQSRNAGIRRIIGWSSDANTLARAERVGFKQIDAAFFAGEF